MKPKKNLDFKINVDCKCVKRATKAFKKMTKHVEKLNEALERTQHDFCELQKDLPMIVPIEIDEKEGKKE